MIKWQGIENNVASSMDLLGIGNKRTPGTSAEAILRDELAQVSPETRDNLISYGVMELWQG